MVGEEEVDEKRDVRRNDNARCPRRKRCPERERDLRVVPREDEADGELARGMLELGGEGPLGGGAAELALVGGC